MDNYEWIKIFQTGKDIAIAMMRRDANITVNS